ncbi:hypothetical protein RJ55_04215 [Drechmeria coniospora]|nr:hypothetical protein RJ55_04215 [Drechmeria coniospora]
MATISSTSKGAASSLISPDPSPCPGRVRQRPSPSTPTRIPPFDRRFASPVAQFYFLHIIDCDTATLEVQVLGANLSFTFTHSRALQASCPSIERKTTGFLAMVRSQRRQQMPPGHSIDAPHDCSERESLEGGIEGGNEQRIVLAWAESGHGVGTGGEMLDAPGLGTNSWATLSNKIWTRRAIRIGRLLGLKMDRPYDNMGSRRLQGEASEKLRGIFLASHVEVKLATHAVYTLLRIFKIPHGGRAGLEIDALRALREARWEDGSRPRVEIYFSRRNCGSCGIFTQRLSQLTGVHMALLWRDRLTKMVYHGRRLLTTEGRRPPPAVRAVEGESLDDGGSARGNRDGNVPLSDVVDLTRASSQQAVDLTRKTPTAECSEHGDDDENEDGGRDGGGGDDGDDGSTRDGQWTVLDAYFDGLAYCVGQLGHRRVSFRSVRAAVVDFARRMLKHAHHRSDNSCRCAFTPNQRVLYQTSGMFETCETASALESAARFWAGRGGGANQRQSARVQRRRQVERRHRRGQAMRLGVRERSRRRDGSAPSSGRGSSCLRLKVRWQDV